MDGPPAPHQGARHLRPDPLPRRQARLSRRHSSLRRLCPQRCRALQRARRARDPARHDGRPRSSGRVYVLKAMILAAGRGERMRPLTDAKPKPMLEAAGKPIIVWTIEALARAGFRELVINVSHFGEVIERGLGDGRRWNVSIRYSRETEPLETAGGIATALPLLGSEPFVVVNGDIYCDFDFRRLRDVLHAPDGPLAHLVLVGNPAHHPSGDFAVQGKRVLNAGNPMYTFSGVGAYRPALFESVAPNTRAQLASLLRPAIEAGHVTGETHAGRWSDIGTPERLYALEALLNAAPGAIPAH